MSSEIKKGIKDSLPIVAGYFSVSFTFGIMASSFGVPPLAAGLISITNLTSAGQFAGLTLMFANAGMLEFILTQVIINLRYALMSLALTQKLDPKISTPKRLLISHVITDEIFAVSISQRGKVSAKYMFGLGIGPLLAWTLGAFTGCAMNDLLPLSVQSALGVALYGMFVAIVMPKVRREASTAVVVAIAVGLSCMLYYVPGLNNISSGFSIIICTVVAAAVGAIFFPKKEEEEAEDIKS